jgi:hypothetical protein
MSAATVAPAGSDAPAVATMPTPAMREACPLCAATLHPDQDWCLNCGAAARTRLAASPRWRGLVAVLAVLVVLSLAVLAAALVKLAGDSGAPATTTTRTITTIAPAGTIVPGTLPGTSTGPAGAPRRTSAVPPAARTAGA